MDCLEQRAEPYPSDTYTLMPGTQCGQLPAPSGRAANNTHNAACLRLLESPVAVLVQLGKDCAREVLPAYNGNLWMPDPSQAFKGLQEHPAESIAVVQLKSWTFWAVVEP